MKGSKKSLMSSIPISYQTTTKKYEQWVDAMNVFYSNFLSNHNI